MFDALTAIHCKVASNFQRLTSPFRLGPGLPGYPIPVCSPRFRISAVSTVPEDRLRFPVFPSNLYGFYPYTTNSIFLSQTLVNQF